MKRSKIVNFTDYLPYAGNRPYATIRLANGNSRTSGLTCLVDTGADFLLVPSSAATSVGLVLPTATAPMATLGGTVNVYTLVGCDVEVEGKMLTGQTVLLDPTGTLPMVLGRDSLLAFCECGFNTSEWVWR